MRDSGLGHRVATDMRLVCPQFIKKMLLKQARTVYWREWAANHEYEELREGIWLEPALALLRRKQRRSGLTSIATPPELVLKGGWVQQRLFDIGWSDESTCEACHKKVGTQALPLPRIERHEVVGTKSKNLKVGVEMAKRRRSPSK